MKNLENLIEMIEMQNELDMLIEEAIGDLTVNEFNMLQEAGLANMVKIASKNMNGKTMKNMTQGMRKMSNVVTPSLQKNAKSMFNKASNTASRAINKGKEFLKTPQGQQMVANAKKTAQNVGEKGRDIAKASLETIKSNPKGATGIAAGTYAGSRLFGGGNNNKNTKY